LRVLEERLRATSHGRRLLSLSRLLGLVVAGKGPKLCSRLAWRLMVLDGFVREDRGVSI
jgi:hypothetical protein